MAEAISRVEYVGRVFAKAAFANITITLLDVGIQMFMCLYGLAVFLETPKPLRQGRIAYIALSFFLFFLSATPAVIDCEYIFDLLLVSGSGEGFGNLFLAGAGSTAMRTFGNTLNTVIVFVADGVLLWRCYILWKDKLWVMAFPGAVYLASIGVGIRCNVFTEVIFMRKLRVAWVFLSVGLNVIITGLITYRILKARRGLSKVLPERNLSMYTGVVAILIESALPMSIFGLAFGGSMIYTLDHFTLSGEISQLLLGLFWYSFIALSPQMIIFRVTTGRSWLNSPLNEDGGSFAVSRPIVFANEPTEQAYLSTIQDGTPETTTRFDTPGGDAELEKGSSLRQRQNAMA